MTDLSRGRRVLLGVGAAVIVLVGVVGFFVGSNAGPARESIRLFGLVAVPTTPGAMAAVAAGVATVLLVLLFGAATLATRYDDEAVR